MSGIYTAIFGGFALVVVGGFASLYYFPHETVGVMVGDLMGREFIGNRDIFGASGSYMPFWIGGGVAGHYLKRGG